MTNPTAINDVVNVIARDAANIGAMVAHLRELGLVVVDRRDIDDLSDQSMPFIAEIGWAVCAVNDVAGRTAEFGIRGQAAEHLKRAAEILKRLSDGMLAGQATILCFSALSPAPKLESSQ